MTRIKKVIGGVGATHLIVVTRYFPTQDQEVGDDTHRTRKVLVSVATQMMTANEVLLDQQRLHVRRVGGGRLRLLQFEFAGRKIEAIEQNPEKPSRWGKLARESHQVVQFRDLITDKYIAVSVDGTITQYGN